MMKKVHIQTYHSTTKKFNVRHISQYSLACAIMLASGLAHAAEQTPSMEEHLPDMVVQKVIDTTIDSTTAAIKNVSSLSKQFLTHLQFSATERSISFNDRNISRWSLVREKFGVVPGNPNSGTSAWMVKYRIYGDDTSSNTPRFLKNASMYSSVGM